MNQTNKIMVGVVSAALISSVSMFEGTKLKPYEDVIGVLTVCTGHTGKDVVKGALYTPEQCKSLLETDLKVHREYVDKCVNVPLSPNEFDAYTMFTYNVGGNAFCGSTLVKKLNAGDHVGACNELLRWSNAGGHYIQGLYNRRVYEQKMCLGGVNGK